MRKHPTRGWAATGNFFVEVPVRNMYTHRPINTLQKLAEDIMYDPSEWCIRLRNCVEHPECETYYEIWRSNYAVARYYGRGLDFDVLRAVHRRQRA